MIVPGAANALSARIIADLGFEAVYVTGAGVTNSFLGLPDLGFVGLSEIAQHTVTIREAVDIPVLVDADTGFGSALNVRQTIRLLERAGANAVQLEDQVMPKKCGHFSEKSIVAIEEMVGKVRAAVDARSGKDLLIIARTDAREGNGFEAAVERCERFIEAGADITFLEAPENIDEVRRIPRLLPVPQVANMVLGGKTPILPAKDLAKMGFGLVLYANAALHGAIAGMQTVLRELKATGKLEETSTAMASFSERQRLVDKPLLDELERRYAGAPSPRRKKK